MDKSTELSNLNFVITPPHKTHTKTELTEESAKYAKTFTSLEDAFAAFDVTDGGVEVELPPVPTKVNIQNQLLQNALLLVDSGEYSLSRNILEEILKKNSQSPEAIRWMGWCYKQEQNLDLALEYYVQLTHLRTVDQDFFELGEIYYAKKQDEEAVAAWQQALCCCNAESPHLFDLHKNLGNAFTRLGDFESAEENYNKALTLRTNSDILQVNFGTLSFQKQSYLQAMAYFKKALEINPFNDRAWMGIALVANEMKDCEWAKATLLRALEINPGNKPAQELLESWEQVPNGN
jgi:tetratricopeptide (TPR) repeat protein